jgi:peptide/nickel transport system substrate-binding protein
MKKFVIGLAGLLLLVMGAALAQQQKQPTIAKPFVWPADWSVGNADAQYGGTFHGYTIGDYKTYNPYLASTIPALPTEIAGGGGSISGYGVALLLRDPTDLSKWVPYMATSYEVSKDNLTITYHIRHDMKFSDGTPITAKDWVSFAKICGDKDVGCNANSEFYIKGKPVVYKALDKYTLQVTYPSFTVDEIARSQFSPWPSHIFDPVYDKGGAAAIKKFWDLSTDPSKIVSPGPWVPTRYSPGERASFARNPYYGAWNTDAKGNQLPYLDGFTVDVVKDLNAALAAYLAGTTDVGPAGTTNYLSQIQKAIKAGNLDATLIPKASPEAQSTWIVFDWNRSKEPFKQMLLRNSDFLHAMSMITNRAAMVKLVYGGLGVPTYTQVYPVFTKWLLPKDQAEKYAYNPEKAAQLLASIGFTKKDSDGYLIYEGSDTQFKGKRLEFDVTTNSGNTQREHLANIFVDEAKKIGVKVNYQPIDFNKLVAELTSQADDRGWDSILLGLGGGGLDWPFGDNVIPCGTDLHAYDYNPKGDCLTPQELLAQKLFYEGQSEPDLQKRIAIGKHLQQVGLDIGAWDFLVAPSYNSTWNNRIGGQFPKSALTAINSDEIFGAHIPALAYVKGK